MTNRENVIAIGRAALTPARVGSPDKREGAFTELAREVVGKHTFVAERGRLRGKNVWRIRIEGTAEVIDYFEPDLHRETFAALVGTEPMLLDDWFAAQASMHKPTR